MGLSRRRLGLGLFVAAFACLFLTLPLRGSAQTDATGGRPYEVRFSAHFVPADAQVRASIAVSQPEHRLRRLNFSAPANRFSDFSGDGEIRREGQRLLWNVPPQGGTLRYRVKVDRARGSAHDAVLNNDWSIARLDSLFPAARASSLKKAHSVSSLQLTGPSAWRYETRYGPLDEAVNIEQPGRSFVRPTGWFSAGRLGIRRDSIDGRQVTIAAPVDQGMRRLDILAFLHWTLPDLIDVFAGFPDRLLITGARDGMWRGGLSGPASLYLHSERPLISENGTSTLLHELVHVAVGAPAGPREDWLIEGLAEYYSLEILRRSGSISKRRYEQTLKNLAAWAKREKGQLTSPSAAADTARAVGVLVSIRKELAKAGGRDFDAVARELVESGHVDRENLAALLQQALGRPSEKLTAALHHHGQQKSP